MYHYERLGGLPGVLVSHLDAEYIERVLPEAIMGGPWMLKAFLLHAVSRVQGWHAFPGNTKTGGLMSG